MPRAAAVSTGLPVLGQRRAQPALHPATRVKRLRGGGSAAAYSQLVATEAEREAAVRRRDYHGQQLARDQCDVLRAELALRASEP